MKTAICGPWHAWDSNNGVMLSDETEKKLREFATWDDCINWLYLNGHVAAARSIHKQHQDSKA